MNFTVFETEGEVASWAADRIEALFARRPEALLCIAAGHSSLGVFDELVRRKVDFSRGWFAAMDEWRGMNEHTRAAAGISCASIFYRASSSRRNTSDWWTALRTISTPNAKPSRILWKREAALT